MKDNKLMIGVAAALLLVAGFYGGQHASAPTAFDIEKQISERVIKLPEDGQAYHVSVVVNPGWQNTPSQRLINYFDTDTRLMGLKSQTHFHVYETNSVMYRDRYAKYWGYNAPMVIVQRGDGQCVYIARMNNIPPTSTKLADEIRSSMTMFAARMGGWGGSGLPSGATKIMHTEHQGPSIKKGATDQFSVIGGPLQPNVSNHPFRPWLDNKPKPKPNDCGPDNCPRPVTPVQPAWTPPWSDPSGRVDGQPVIPDTKGLPNDQLVGIAVIVILVGFFYWKKKQESE